MTDQQAGDPQGQQPEESWHTLSHVAGQPCDYCVEHGIQLPSAIRRSLVFLHGRPERHTVGSICIHHPLNLQEQRYLNATGYAAVNRDLIMVQTTFCIGTLAWEPFPVSQSDQEEDHV